MCPKSSLSKLVLFIFFLTVNFKFTYFVESILVIPSRIRRTGPVVVIDDVSPVCDTGYVCRVWDCGSSVVGVPKTQHSVLFSGWVWHVNRESQESSSVAIFIICKSFQRYTYTYKEKTSSIILTSFAPKALLTNFLTIITFNIN